MESGGGWIEYVAAKYSIQLMGGGANGLSRAMTRSRFFLFFSYSEK
jgi:hypothetical protein